MSDERWPETAEPGQDDPVTPVDTVVIDDHPVILAGIEAWFRAARPAIRVVAAGADVGVVRRAPGDGVRVVILDLHLDGGSATGFTVLRELVEEGRRVIVFSMLADPESVLRAIDLGAFTYLTKAEGERHLVAAVHAAATDRPYLPPVLAGAMRMDVRPSAPRLAPREKEVLLEWFQADSKEMVGRKLHLSARTVEGYLNRIRVKYANVGREAPTKAALVARAIQDGLVDPGDL